MRILVFDVPASSGGALSILEDFYNEVKNMQSNETEWIFVISTPNMKETSNIKILKYPWIKKTWIHRIIFDYFVSPCLVRRYGADKIISFQNVTVPYTKVTQVLYMHNSIPFIDIKFKLRSQSFLWIYQNVIGRRIIQSIRKADRTIVQTEWVKRAIRDKVGEIKGDILVSAPNINVEISKTFLPQTGRPLIFFYPASADEYKNHIIVVKAVERMGSELHDEFKVIFTIKGDENSHIKEMFNDSKKKGLPIQFAGKMTREQVFEMYTKSILLFPSYLETYGLPLMEARMHECMILASDCLFSHEILDNYSNVYYFNPFEPAQLTELLLKVINGEMIYHEDKFILSTEKKGTSLLDLIF